MRGETPIFLLCIFFLYDAFQKQFFFVLMNYKKSLFPVRKVCYTIF